MERVIGKLMYKIALAEDIYMSQAQSYNFYNDLAAKE